MKKTSSIKKEDIKPEWFLVDASGVRLGRLASFVARILQGKTKAKYAPHVDCGDYVIVINSKNIDVHKSRLKRKIYRRHTGYPGGLKSMTFEELFAKNPKQIIQKAVWGMMPKTKLGKAMMRKFIIYEDEKHEHSAQKPKLLKVN